MKRCMMLLLLLAILITSRTALAASGYLETGSRLGDVVVADDTVYYMLEDTREVYAWRPGEESAVYCGQGGEALLSAGSGLYTLDHDAMSLRLLAGADAGFDGMKLPIDKLVKDRNTYWNACMMQWTPDGLYWLMSIDYSDDVELCRYDPMTDSFSHKKVSRLMAFCLRGDGSLYVVEPDYEGRKVSRFDWAGKKLEYVAHVPQGSNGFVMQGEDLLCVADKEVFRMAPDGSVASVMKVPVSMDSRFSGCLMQGDCYVTGMWDKLGARSISQSSAQAVRLTVLGGEGFADDGFTRFMLAHPEVDVTLLDMGDITDASALMQKLMTGELEYDVILLNEYFDLQQLMARGYLQDLSSDEALMQGVGRMCPALQSAVMSNGRLYAVPCSVLGSNLMVYYPEQWERAGLADRVPSSWAELLQFIIDDYPALSDEGVLFAGVTPGYERQALFGALMRQAVMEAASAGEPIRMNTPAFKALLDQFERAMAVAERGRGDSYCLMDVGVGNSTNALQRYAAQMLLLSLDGAEAPVVPVRMQCYAVNPRSEHQELAIEYVRTCMDAVSANMRLTLWPDERTPILSSYYQLYQPQQRAEIDALESQVAAMEDSAEKRELQELLVVKYQELEALESTKYEVSMEMIDCYRERIAPHLFVPNSMALSVTDVSGERFIFDNAIGQYEDHRMSADQFAAEIDRIIVMIEMERME